MVEQRIKFFYSSTEYARPFSVHSFDWNPSRFTRPVTLVRSGGPSGDTRSDGPQRQSVGTARDSPWRQPLTLHVSTGGAGRVPRGRTEIKEFHDDGNRRFSNHSFPRYFLRPVSTWGVDADGCSDKCSDGRFDERSDGRSDDPPTIHRRSTDGPPTAHWRYPEGRYVFPRTSRYIPIQLSVCIFAV